MAFSLDFFSSGLGASVFFFAAFFSFGFASSGFGSGTAGAGLGSYLKVSTNFVSAISGRNFWMSMEMPRFAIWMPST